MLLRRRGLCGGSSRRDGLGGRRAPLPTQNFKHHCPAGRAFAFDGFAPVFHRFLDPIDDFLFRLALDAVSFGHKKYCCPGASCTAAVTGHTLGGAYPYRQLLKGTGNYGASFTWKCPLLARPVVLVSHCGHVTCIDSTNPVRARPLALACRRFCHPLVARKTRENQAR